MVVDCAIDLFLKSTAGRSDDTRMPVEESD